MRWVNNHVYYLKAKSPVGLRILHTVLALPYEDSDLWRTRVLDHMCRPYGYKPVTDHVKFRDVYNICVLKRVLAAEDNKQDDLDNVLFDHPLVRRQNTIAHHRLCSGAFKCHIPFGCSDSGLVGPALALRHLSSGEPKAPEVLRSSEPVMPQYRQEVGCKVVCGEH